MTETDLNRWLAVHCMEWKQIEERDSTIFPNEFWVEPDGTIATCTADFRPTTSIADAFRCLEKLTEGKGRWYRIDSGDGFDSMAYDVIIFLNGKQRSYMVPDKDENETLPMCISLACKAALSPSEESR